MASTLFSENKCPFYFILDVSLFEYRDTIEILIIWISRIQNTWIYCSTRDSIAASDTNEIPAYFMLACIIWCMDESVSNAFFFPLLSLTQRVCFKKGYYILAEAITLLSICIRIAHKSFDFGALMLLMLLASSSNWKTDRRSLSFLEKCWVKLFDKKDGYMNIHSTYF